MVRLTPNRESSSRPFYFSGVRAVLHCGKVLADTTPTQFIKGAGAATIEQAFLAMTGAAA